MTNATVAEVEEVGDQHELKVSYQQGAGEQKTAGSQTIYVPDDLTVVKMDKAPDRSVLQGGQTAFLVVRDQADGRRRRSRAGPSQSSAVKNARRHPPTRPCRRPPRAGPAASASTTSQPPARANRRSPSANSWGRAGAWRRPAEPAAGEEAQRAGQHAPERREDAAPNLLGRGLSEESLLPISSSKLS